MTPSAPRQSKSPEIMVFRWFLLMGVLFIGAVLALLLFNGSGWLAVMTWIPALVIVWLFIAFHTKTALERYFFSLANVIESLRVGDFSQRISTQPDEGAWSQVYSEINRLAEHHQVDRMQAVESDILLDKLLAEFDIPVFVFDLNGILKHLNPKSCELFTQSRDALLGMHVGQLDMQTIFDANQGDVVDHWFPSKGGRWVLRKNYFIQKGQRYTLLLINDLSRTLREEERTAWLRLIRVLGHELNNSLASLISVSETLSSNLHHEKTEEWFVRYEKALALIQDRSRSLLRFTDAYTRLAKLPKPNRQPTDLLALVNKLADLQDGNFIVKNSSPLVLSIDADQIEQMVINLLKNAVEASSSQSPVTVTWQSYNQGVRLQIIDEGMGLPGSDNLFVPFYTTKQNGSGIGLFLCRQIAEAHNGTLRLVNRDDRKGCIAECWLPHPFSQSEA